MCALLREALRNSFWNMHRRSGCAWKRSRRTRSAIWSARRDDELELEAERLLLRKKQHKMEADEAERLEQEKYEAELKAKIARARAQDKAAEADSDSDSDSDAGGGRSGRRTGRNPKRKKKKGDEDSDDACGIGGGRTGRRAGRNPNRKKKGKESAEEASSGSDDGKGRVRRRKGRNPRKKEEKEYKIFFIVDVRLKGEEGLEDKIAETAALRAPLADMFETAEEEHVFDIKTRARPGGKAFKFEFGIKIATEQHPADYINIFDTLTSKDDPKIQDALVDALGLDNEPQINVWEARYEKLEKAKK